MKIVLLILFFFFYFVKRESSVRRWRGKYLKFIKSRFIAVVIIIIIKYYTRDVYQDKSNRITALANEETPLSVRSTHRYITLPLLSSAQVLGLVIWCLQISSTLMIGWRTGALIPLHNNRRISNAIQST